MQCLPMLCDWTVLSVCMCVVFASSDTAFHIRGHSHYIPGISHILKVTFIKIDCDLNFHAVGQYPELSWERQDSSKQTPSARVCILSANLAGSNLKFVNTRIDLTRPLIMSKLPNVPPAACNCSQQSGP